MKQTYFHSVCELRDDHIQLVCDGIIVPNDKSIVNLEITSKGVASKTPLDPIQLVKLRDSITELLEHLEGATQLSSHTSSRKEYHVVLKCKDDVSKEAVQFYRDNDVKDIYNPFIGGTFRVESEYGYRTYEQKFEYLIDKKTPLMIELLQKYLMDQDESQYFLQVFCDDKLTISQGTFHYPKSAPLEEDRELFAIGFLGGARQVKTLQKYIEMAGTSYLLPMFDNGLLMTPTADNNQSYFGALMLTKDQVRQSKLAFRLFDGKFPLNTFLLEYITQDGTSVVKGELDDSELSRSEFRNNMRILWDGHMSV